MQLGSLGCLDVSQPLLWPRVGPACQEEEHSDLLKHRGMSLEKGQLWRDQELP